MQLIQFPHHKIFSNCMALLPVIWIGLQLKAYYWLLTILAIILLCRIRKSLSHFFSSTLRFFLSSLLVLLSLSLLASAAVENGLTGIITEFPVTLPMVPIFILSCAFSAKEGVGVSRGSRYILYLSLIGVLVLLEALYQGFNLSDSPVSSLRPFEIQASSAIFLLTAISISHSYRSASRHLRINPAALYCLPLSIFSFLAFVCFRGATSMSALAINIIAVTVICVLPVIRVINVFLLVPSIAVLIVGITMFLDFRFMLLKYIVAPFLADNVANGRLSLLQTWISDYGDQPLRLIGPQASVPIDFFAHNIIFDSMIKDGLIPAASILLFFLIAIAFLAKDFFRCIDMYRFLNLALLLLMAFPALLQPVQFSHAFAFLLSISTVAILISMPLGGTPEVFCGPANT